MQSAAQLIGVLTFIVATLATPLARGIDWPGSSWFGSPPAVGTKEWWDKHVEDRVFVIGKGYTVPGVDGYFDGNGHPMTQMGATAANPAGIPVVAIARPDADKDKEAEGLIPGLDPSALYKKTKTAVGLGPNDQVARQAFAEGDQLFLQKSYKAAAKKYEEAVDRAVDMRIREDAMFMRAESYYFADEYVKARDAYNELAEKYPSTRQLDKLIDHEWKVAQYWEKEEDYNPHHSLTINVWDKTRPWFDTMGHSIRTYENIRMNDPTGPRADDAIMAEAGIYFRHNQYEDADYNYTLLRREYPRSKHQFEAHLLGLQAKLRKYQGADYDGAPLEQAQQLVKQLRTNFAGQLSAEERERLKTVAAQLNEELASRDMKMGKYYDGIKHYGAAKEYYAIVIKKYPDSELAKEARDRMGAIASLPEEPSKPLATVVGLFPKSAEHASLAKIPELQNGTLIAQRQDAAGSDTAIGQTPAATTTK
ncbi:MAG TPA: outer membrane protein assembly factor BamD [Lacipirellulaceae bacterium]|jgi:outer membrane protein assembly factor BamD (BamD/ComL family)